MLALADGNAFFCSCEAVFDPRVRGKPFVVLSSNDGNAVARNDEAKALGIKMGQPAFELKPLVKSHGLMMRSSNFTLYGDMSARVLAVTREMVPHCEPYSVDENFLFLGGIRDRVAFCHELRDRIRQWTGIPTCIGIGGKTKTLAKLANKAAKKGAGVIDLSDEELRREVLATFPIEDVWGVGPRYAARLKDMSIETAAQLRDAPNDYILEQFGVVLSRTQRELQGHSCIAMQDIEPDRKQIVVSRSFGERISDPVLVHQAIATFAVRATEKMRRRGLVTTAITVFANTDWFRAELPQHHPSRTVVLQAATADTRVILQAVSSAVSGMFTRGMAYKKAGIALLDLARPGDVQADLFGPRLQGDEKLMAALDQINAKFGRGAAGFGSTGWKKRPEWRVRAAHISPCYTTRMSDLPRVRC